MSPAGAQRERRPRLSLRLMLTLWILVIAGVIQLTSMAIGLLYLKSTLSDYFDRRLDLRAAPIADAVRASGGGVSGHDLSRLLHGSPTAFNETLAATILAADGAVIASSHVPAVHPQPAPVAALADASSPRFLRARVGGLDDQPDPAARMALIPITREDGATVLLLVAASDTTYEGMMQVAARVVWLALPTGVGAAAIAGWLIGGIAIAPLEGLRRMTASLAPDTLHAPVGRLGEFREAAELERDLEETRARLRHAFQAQDRFIANVSHELKTPIAVILTEAQTLGRQDLPAVARRFIQSTTEEMQRLGNMIESFLTLTRLRSGAAPAALVPADLNAVAMEAVVECRAVARLCHVEVVPQLSDSDTPVQVLGDSGQLQLMVLNLLHNAVRFSPQGRQVLVRVGSSDTQCSLSVRDFGPGVPAEMIDTLFDRFGEHPARPGRGRGLGLAIAQAVAELHGGSITVENLKDGGCEFCAKLPKAARAA